MTGIAQVPAAPWEAFTHDVSKEADLASLLVAGGLDWEAERAPLHSHTADGNSFPVPRRDVLYRSNISGPPTILSVAHTNWKVVKNESLVGLISEFCTVTGAKLERLGTVENDRKIIAIARIPGAEFSIGRGDAHEVRLLFVSSNEPGFATKIKGFAFRIRCLNQMPLLMRGKSKAGAHVATIYSQAHHHELDVDGARDALGAAVSEFGAHAKRCRTLAKLKLSVADAMRKVIIPTFAPEMVGEMITDDQLMDSAAMPSGSLSEILWAYKNAPGHVQDETGWAALNAGTYYLDHMKGRKPSRRFVFAALGKGADQKMQLEERLMELAQ